MIRDPAALARSEFDLAVVGGGIYGICAAHEAARRGLAVCLVERGDFVSATSSNSLKTVHGGLRYLQHGDLRRMRESIRERAMLLRTAPHLVRPLPFVIPTHGHGLGSKAVMRTALLLNDLVGFDRSAGVREDRRIPPGRVIGREEVRAMVPDLDARGLTGGAIWYDCQIANTERLALAYLRSAVDHGAVCANYVEATGLLLRDGRVQGVRARDRLGGDVFEIRARTVLNAAGPWADRLLQALPGARTVRRFHPSKGMNLVTRRLFGDHAIGFTVPTEFRDSDAVLNKGTRLFFVVPWKQFSLIGTRHLLYQGDPDDFRITEDDIEVFLGEINAACPSAALSRKDVLAVLGGLLPEVPRAGPHEVQLVKHSRVYDHAGEGAVSLFSAVGVKWTTARLTAEEAVDLVERRLRPGESPRRPAERPLPGGDIEELDGTARETAPAGVSTVVMHHLRQNYGSIAGELFGYVRADPSLGAELVAGSPVIGAEIVFGVEREMAQRLDDVVLRRTELSAGGYPGPEALRRCAELMGSVLEWSPERRESEIARTEAMLRQGLAITSS
ncbi:MAG TPA: glycerol-3-phosphate dehydrogenase/oxidase [Gemmatimonadales bacterium]|nr:glycerol-3-phosphate dehydrogenase/oxidase [Gemmatimonadales bacterium]